MQIENVKKQEIIIKPHSSLQIFIGFDKFKPIKVMNNAIVISRNEWRKGLLKYISLERYLLGQLFCTLQFLYVISNLDF